MRTEEYPLAAERQAHEDAADDMGKSLQRSVSVNHVDEDPLMYASHVLMDRTEAALDSSEPMRLTEDGLDANPDVVRELMASIAVQAACMMADEDILPEIRAIIDLCNIDTPNTVGHQAKDILAHAQCIQGLADGRDLQGFLVAGSIAIKAAQILEALGDQPVAEEKPQHPHTASTRDELGERIERASKILHNFTSHDPQSERAITVIRNNLFDVSKAINEAFEVLQWTEP